MKSLLSGAGGKALENKIKKNPILIFDYDGTLAPFKVNLAEADLPSTTQDLMDEICKTFAVAIVSGRSWSDLSNRLTIKPEVVIGNHGIEIPWISSKKERHRQEKFARIVNAWAHQLKLIGLGSDIKIENKSLSISVHFRNSRNPTHARRQCLAAIGSLSPKPFVIPGKSIFNLLPQGARCKDGAVLEIMKRLKRSEAIFVGDDVTDDIVFDLRNPRIFGIRIGKSRVSKAHWYISSQNEINRLLSLILKFK